MIATCDYAATSTTQRAEYSADKSKTSAPVKPRRTQYPVTSEEADAYPRTLRIASRANKVSLDIVGVQVRDMHIVEGYGLAVAEIDNGSGGGICHVLQRIVAIYGGSD
jgi:hypothetical protein